MITGHIAAAMPESPTTKLLISVGPEVPEGFLDFHEGIRHAAPFVRPQHVNTNDDIMLMYFTSGTTGEPKMVAHYSLNIFSEIPFYELSLYIRYLQMFSFDLNTHEISLF